MCARALPENARLHAHRRDGRLVRLGEDGAEHGRGVVLERGDEAAARDGGLDCSARRARRNLPVSRAVAIKNAGGDEAARARAALEWRLARSLVRLAAHKVAGALARRDPRGDRALCRPGAWRHAARGTRRGAARASVVPRDKEGVLIHLLPIEAAPARVGAREDDGLARRRRVLAVRLLLLQPMLVLCSGRCLLLSQRLPARRRQREPPVPLSCSRVKQCGQQRPRPPFPIAAASGSADATRRALVSGCRRRGCSRRAFGPARLELGDRERVAQTPVRQKIEHKPSCR